jgi:hypothetical protein
MPYAFLVNINERTGYLYVVGRSRVNVLYLSEFRAIEVAVGVMMQQVTEGGYLQFLAQYLATLWTNAFKVFYWVV